MNSPCSPFGHVVRALDFHALGAVYSSFVGQRSERTHIPNQKKCKLKTKREYNN